MPVPRLFQWSPRPDQDQLPNASPASQSSSRFGLLHSNVRSMINGSSVYSQSPNPNQSATNTPKIPFFGFLRRPQSPPAPIVDPENTEPPRESGESRSPLYPRHTANSYMRTIAPLQDPRQPETTYSREPLDRHPADVPLDYERTSVDPETEQLQDEIHNRQRRRRRRHKRRKHHQRQQQWVRRGEQRGRCVPSAQGSAARSKLLSCIISGLFLATVLAIYLALALSRHDLGQEVHVLFIMIILGITIFFCHCLIRLFMLILHPPADSDVPRIPSMTGPEGFHPVRPIRVHLARDEELADAEDEHNALDAAGEEKRVAPPPPAYGLWRSSVRVDPNLLHWQRVEDTNNSSSSASSPRQGSRNGSVSGAGGVGQAAPAGQEQQGPRPPSYVSDDGVSYVVEAAPRSVAPSHSGMSDVHPAWRPGYAISEVEWPRPLRV